MKNTILLLAAITMLSVQAFSQTKKQADTIKKLPAGTYYIINVETGYAITPAMSSLGQSVFQQDFTKDATQKWKVIPKTKSYVIQLSGFNDLIFQPHPSVQDHTPILSLPGTGNDQFSIIPTSSGHWLIKSRNGKYLHSYTTSTGNELRFGSIEEGEKTHLWEFRRV
jgi:hypothetical protein